MRYGPREDGDVTRARVQLEMRSPRGRPPGKFTQHRRMSELRQLLSRHPKGVTLAEIAAHLDVTTRSARRYLDELKLDLEAVPERPGGQKRWRIPSVDLPRRVLIRRTQAYALLATRALFDPMRGSTLYEEIDLASQTLLSVARRAGRGPNAGRADAELERRFRYLPFAPKDYGGHGETVDTVFQCVAELRPLRCGVPDARGQVERVTLHPYALLLYKDAMHCLAMDVAEAQVRAIRVEWMHDPLALDEHFEIAHDFAVDDYVQGQFGLWKAERPAERVAVELDPRVAEVALSRSFHPSQRVARRDDGSVELSFELADLTEVTTWVLGFGSLARVLSPHSLREAVKGELIRALERY